MFFSLFGRSFRHSVQVVKKDVDFLKKNIGAGINWMSEALGLPDISKKVDEFVWLLNLEDPHYSGEFQSPSWPRPYYPGFAFSHFLHNLYFWHDLLNRTSLAHAHANEDNHIADVESDGFELEISALLMKLRPIKQESLIRDNNKLILLASLSNSLE
ncbi:unnamed protein product [Lactuca saligna]|uniref:Uncharacterized protein n=1 Tax=Lactuca saligna TaxID=75948 RepID=A0AA35V898_LACSI|nr:unnamed protein product [Lactuca saligna]